MIAAASRVLAPDEALPRRDELLDCSVMRSVLSRLGADAPVRVDACTLVRVNYAVARALRAGLRFEVAASSSTVAARMSRGTKSIDAYRRSVESTRLVGPLKGIELDTDLGCVFWVVPNDRKIDSLAAVLDP